MSINTIYQLFLYVIKKNQSADLSPDEFNNIWNLAQINFMDYLLGEFQQYQYGKSVARVEIGQNQTVLQRLTPLIDSPVTLTINSNGVAPNPSDYQQACAMYTTAMNKVSFVQQDSLYSRLQSVIDPVTTTNPIYLIENNQFQFYPTSLGSALLSYVKTPPAAKYAYIIDGSGNPIFDPGNSIDPVFFDTDCWTIASRALEMVGINLQAPLIQQYANNIKNNGV